MPIHKDFRPDAWTLSLMDVTTMLTARDAAVAILQDRMGRYLLQRRDPDPSIWFPDHWGFFGGAVDAGEDAPMAVRRELHEEIGVCVSGLHHFMSLTFQVDGLGGRPCLRDYYHTVLPDADLQHIRLGEGSEWRLVEPVEALSTLRVAAYDAFALFLHFRSDHVTIADHPSDDD